MSERVVSVGLLRKAGIPHCRRAPGFTLIDVLVTMAVIAVLIAILSPAMSSIREAAREVVCRSNMRQIGIGIAMYADENSDRIPPSVNAPTTQNGQPWETMDLRLDPTASGLPGHWDGLGHLYNEAFLPAPKLFYCPSHHGSHPYADYAAAWAGRADNIVGNFQYRAVGLSQRKVPANQIAPLEVHLSQIVTTSALVADGMRTQEDFNHRIGANVLRAGLSVDWWRDPGNFVDGLPKEGQLPTQSIQQAWESLDIPVR